MKKVLFINTYDDPCIGGGTEIAIDQLARGMAERGVEPVVLSTTDRSGLHKSERDGLVIWRAGIRNAYWPHPSARPGRVIRALWHVIDSYNVAMQPLLRRVLKIERPDVVSMHNLSGWSAASWKTISDLQTPTVQVLHDSYNICPRVTMYGDLGSCVGQCKACSLLRMPHPKLSNRVSAVVAVSQFILERHLHHGYFGDVSNRRVIYDTRDSNVLGTNNKKDGTPDSDSVRFGFIGRLDVVKGVEYLLTEFRKAGLGDSELVVAGSGRFDFEQHLRKRFSSAQVRFIGRVAPRDLFSQVDVVIVPSLWHEPLGMVVAEALAFGKPVIGSRRGGIPEMIRHEENGVLFDPEQPGDLIFSMRLLASDKHLRERMSRAASASAKQFLDRAGWLSQYYYLYQQVSG